jgi:chaperone LolA
MVNKIILLMMVCMVGLSQSADVKAIVREIQEKYEDLEYLSATFVQSEEFKLTGSRNETQGRIYVKNGIEYRLETEDQIIVTDGKSVWTYSPFNNQVLIDRVKEGDGSLLPRDLLFRYPRDYMATLVDEQKIDGDKFYVLKLDPKEGVYGYIKTMKIWVNARSYIITRIEYEDFNENVSSFEVQQIDTKTTLPEDLFRFEIKEGMEVVDLRM